ncbi:MAG: hypothetical protein RLZZ385_90 [Pseudomonadota bacterium]
MSTPTVPAAESLLAAVRRFTRASLSAGPVLSAGQLNRSEWHLMWLLRDWPDAAGARPSALAQRQGVTAGSVAQQLRHLEELGLVVRDQDRDDRRVVRVRLTAAGRRRLKQLHKAFVQQFEGLATHLGGSDSERLLRLLTSAADYLERRGQGSC